jgi:FG-GAP repeat
MTQRYPSFSHIVIDPAPPGAAHDIVLIADLNADGRLDIIIGAKQGDPNLFWY